MQNKVVFVHQPLTWREVLNVKNKLEFIKIVELCNVTGYEYFYYKGKIFDKEGYQLGAPEDFSLNL